VALPADVKGFGIFGTKERSVIHEANKAGIEAVEPWTDVSIDDLDALVRMLRGEKPIVAIYSTFLQRGYDQVIHDVSLENLDVIFAIDRAGLVGGDGATHQGVYDLAYLRALPNLQIGMPRDARQMRGMLKTALAAGGPKAVRWPRGQVDAPPDAGVDAWEEIPWGRGEVLKEGRDVWLLTLRSGRADRRRRWSRAATARASS
jgi:deoxyxylulose-5-phosphate synthase